MRLLEIQELSYMLLLLKKISSKVKEDSSDAAFEIELVYVIFSGF